MKLAEYDTMRSIEDDYWWYRALRQHVVRSIQPPTPRFRLLDAGCGTGGMLAALRKSFPPAELTGLDFSERALQITAQRETGATLVNGSADDLPFPDSEFDVVLSLDVLVSKSVDDRAAIQESYRVLRPGGTLILNLAAFDFLKGSHDTAVHMARRYTRPKVAGLIREVGFDHYALSYWNMLLLPAVALVRWLTRSRMHDPAVHSDLVPLPAPLNAILTKVTQIELALSRVVALPFGTSVFGLATK
jgi:ubiquinone/menaquinone biosynthesis C-methylase UbiE